MSGVARYIAESKLDREREGERARPLFSDHNQELTYRAANRLISANREGPSKKDVIHLVISPAREEYERLGSNDEERMEALRNVTKGVVRETEKATNVEQLHWFAGIHRNTDNPHVHLVIGRDAISRETSRPTRIEHLPKELLSHKELGADGKRHFVEGRLVERVIAELEIAQEHARANEGPSREAQTHDQGDRAREAAKTTTKSPELEHSEPSREEAHDDRSEARTQTRDSGNGVENGENSRQEIEWDYESLEEPDHEPLEEHDPTRNDRVILGRAMVARGEYERLTVALHNAREHGDKRRFRIFDSTHNRTRRISEFDIKRRSDALAMRQVADKVIPDKTKRHAERQSLYELEVKGHSHGIVNHQTILQKTIKKIEGDLKRAKTDYEALHSRALIIVRDYQTAGKPLPPPIISSKELTKLQDQAIAAKDTKRLLMLEDVRQQISEALQVPTRSTKESARVQGQLIVARSDERVKEQRLNEFEQNRHMTRWEIKGEKWSLAEVDKQISLKLQETKILNHPEQLIPTGSRSVGGAVARIVTTLGKNSNLLPSGRRAAAAEVARLTEIRNEIQARIEERRDRLQGELGKCAKLSETLGVISQAEAARIEQAGKVQPAPLLTRPELNRLEANSLIAKDPEMLKTFQAMEADHADKLSPGQRMSPAVMAGRAAAREVMAEIALRESEEKLAAFTSTLPVKDKPERSLLRRALARSPQSKSNQPTPQSNLFQPVLITDSSGQERVVTAWEYREDPRPIHRAIGRAFEASERQHIREEIDRSLEERATQLEHEVEQSRTIFEMTRGVADGFREMFSERGAEAPQPIFTPKEIVQLEIYAVRHPSEEVRQQTQSLIERAELEGRVLMLETEERDQDKSQQEHSQPDAGFAPASEHDDIHIHQQSVNDHERQLGDDFTLTH